MGNDKQFSRRKKSRPGFALIDGDILTSAAWKQLNGGAVKLYVFFRSKTFGPLGNVVKTPLKKISWEQMIRGTGLSRQTIRDRLITLEHSGFLDFTKHGGLKSQGKTCNEYQLSQRFLLYNSLNFLPGKEKKSKGYRGTGFNLMHEKRKQKSIKEKNNGKEQKASIVSIPEQSNFYTSKSKTN